MLANERGLLLAVFAAVDRFAHGSSFNQSLDGSWRKVFGTAGPEHMSY